MAVALNAGVSVTWNLEVGLMGWNLSAFMENRLLKGNPLSHKLTASEYHSKHAILTFAFIFLILTYIFNDV